MAQNLSFLTFFFFSASKAYGVTLQVRVEESVYVCVSNYFVLKQI